MKNMKKILAITMVVMSVLVVTVSAMATTTGVYNTAAVHLRSTIGGTSLGLVSKNATCNILSESTVGGVKWYKVKITSHTSNTPDLYNKTGWSWAMYITTNGGSIPEGPQSATEAFGSSNLSTGSSGNYVRNVQSCLLNGRNQYNESYYTGLIDGDFGNLTYSAVTSFQAENGLVSDGIVGNATKAKLWELYSQYCIY